MDLFIYFSYKYARVGNKTKRASYEYANTPTRSVIILIFVNTTGRANWRYFPERFSVSEPRFKFFTHLMGTIRTSIFIRIRIRGRRDVCTKSHGDPVAEYRARVLCADGDSEHCPFMMMPNDRLRLKSDRRVTLFFDRSRGWKSFRNVKPLFRVYKRDEFENDSASRAHRFIIVWHTLLIIGVRTDNTILLISARIWIILFRAKIHTNRTQIRRIYIVHFIFFASRSSNGIVDSYVGSSRHSRWKSHKVISRSRG